MQATGSPSKLFASLTIFFCAGIWGLFWIPLHYFNDNGLGGVWVVTAINLSGLLIAAPVAFWKAKITRSNAIWLLAIGTGMGLSNVFYFAGLILSDVVRVVFLFYLLPIWATLFSWAFFGVQIGKQRFVALGFAFVGIWLLLGGGSWPIPQNLGDIFGLLSGMGWAMGLVIIRDRQDMDALAVSATTLLSATTLSLILGVILTVWAPEIQPQFPTFSQFSGILPFVVAFGVIILWPSMFGQLWGAKFVAATTAALLTMSEVVVSTISTTMIIGSLLNWISWLGGGLIIIAILIDLFAPEISQEQ